MKNKIVIGIACLFLTLGIIFARGNKLAAVTDTCTGVQTTFNASFPSSVTSGQALTIANITQRPDTSYGVTVNSSTLYMSATNASQSSYTMTNTSTNPSPTTGASTYTAFYPNWALTATGAGGSQIVVKLVKVTADVQGIGTITCPLSATLATINIVAPAASGGSTTANNSSNNSSTTTNKPTGSSNTTSQTPTNQTTSQSQTEKATLNVVVKDKNSHEVKGAKVTLDNQQTATTDTEGSALFKDVTAGDHSVKVSYKDQTLEKTVTVGSGNPTSDVTITLPIATELPYKLFMEIASGVIALAVIIWLTLRLKSRFTGFKPVGAVASTSQTQVFSGDMSIAPPEIVSAAPHAPTPPAPASPVTPPTVETATPSTAAIMPAPSVPASPVPLPPAQPPAANPATTPSITKLP